MTAPLFKHQREAIDFAMDRNGNAAILHEMGLGKTRTAIEIFKRLRVSEPGLKMLVAAPLSLLRAAWGEDIRKFSEFSFQDLHDSPMISEKPDIYLINFEALISEKREQTIRAFAQNYQIFCVVDESSRMKNHKAKTTKTLLSLCPLFKHRIVMTGTPAPNCETEYWAQMEFVKPGILHKSFYAFRNTFFHLERNGTKLIQQGAFMTRNMAREIFSKGFQYAITDANRARMMAFISPVCHFAKKDECLDLPDQINEVREVTMTAPQSKIYNEMKRELYTEIEGSEITAQAALTKIIKLREITSGFAMTAEGDAVDIGDSPKLKELLTVVEEAGDQQMIIWANFHWEIRKIREALAPIGRVVTLYSETEDRNESINDFISGNARFLVAHPRSAAHGLTFVNCSVQVFFSLDYSYEAHEQARARTHRAGQKRACVYVYLIAKDSIDEVVMKCLKSKQTAQEIIYQLFPKLEKVAA